MKRAHYEILEEFINYTFNDYYILTCKEVHLNTVFDTSEILPVNILRIAAGIEGSLRELGIFHIDSIYKPADTHEVCLKIKACDYTFTFTPLDNHIVHTNLLVIAEIED
jgi:hypothetical protein